MKDYLRELCTNLNIELVYIEDDYTALTGGIEGGKPFIKVDRLFQGCPQRVAKAIVGYCTESENEDEYLSAIRNYIFEHVITVNYRIDPPGQTFKRLFIKHIDAQTPPEDITPQNVISENKTTKAKTTKSRTPRAKTSKSTTPKAGAAKSDTSSLVEMNISSITRKSFYGGVSNIDPDETIKPSADDVIELEIEVDSPKK